MCARPSEETKRSRTPTLGVLTPFLDGFFFGDVIGAIDAAARVYAARVVIIETAVPWAEDWSQDAPRADSHLLVAWDHLDGLIAVTDVLTEHLRDLIQASGKPLVTISATNPMLQYPAVLLDSRNAALAAVRHLLEHGHRRIAFAGWLGSEDGRLRHEGYCAALVEGGIAPEPSLVFAVADNHESGGQHAGAAMLAAGMQCTAVLVSTDMGALGLMNAVRAAGYRVPEDLAVVGFDDIDIAAQNTPPLTTTAHRFDMLGTVAVEQLLALLANRLFSSGPVFTPSALVRRRSCGCAEQEPASACREVPYTRANWRDELGGRLASLALGTLRPTVCPYPELVWPGAGVVVDALEAVLQGSAGPACRRVDGAWQAFSLRASSAEAPACVQSLLEQAALEYLRLHGCQSEEPRLRLAAFIHEAGASINRSGELSGMRGARTHMNPRVTSYQLSAALFRPGSGTAADLAWARYSPLHRCCLGLWETDSPTGACALVVRGVYDADGMTEGILGQRLAQEAFPPRAFLSPEGDLAAWQTVLVMPLASTDCEWGFLATHGLRDPRSYHAENESLRLLPSLLTMALQHEALSRKNERSMAAVVRVQEELLRKQAALEAANDEIRRLSHYDTLTGVYNRRAIEEAVAGEKRRTDRYAGREQLPFSLLFVDLDDFKFYNDTGGHAVGDAALKAFAALLTATTRAADVVARFGGDEFMLLLPETDTAGASMVAGRIIKRLQQAHGLCRAISAELEREVVLGAEHWLGCSIGIAGYIPGTSIDATIRRADAALYRAKRHGKGCYCVAADSESSQA
jgi:diguanylate cyclase (GGDEF)-like protein